jgi:hypothetical protein
MQAAFEERAVRLVVGEANTVHQFRKSMELDIKLQVVINEIFCEPIEDTCLPINRARNLSDFSRFGPDCPILMKGVQQQAQSHLVIFPTRRNEILKLLQKEASKSFSADSVEEMTEGKEVASVWCADNDV